MIDNIIIACGYDVMQVCNASYNAVHRILLIPPTRGKEHLIKT